MPRDSGILDSAGQTVSSLTISKALGVEITSSTSVTINIDKTSFTVIPTSYRVRAHKLIFDESGIYVPDINFQTIVRDYGPSETLTITGLVPGDTYYFFATAYLNLNSGNTAYSEATPMPVDGANLKPFSNTPTTFKASKSYVNLSVSEDDYKNKKLAVAHKVFPAITVIPATDVSKINGDNYANAGYYSFGTSILMDNSLDNTAQSGGFGFFVNSTGTIGYYVILESTSSISTFDQKAVRIVKFVGNKIITLKEVGTRTESTIEGIYGGRIYNVDIKVKVKTKSVYIDAYINGYKISYVDTTYKSNKITETMDQTAILTPTSRVALLCMRGTVSFDYAYGKSLQEFQYNELLNLNFYQGQFSNDLINTTYGDLAYTGQYKDDEITSNNLKETGLDEFGTVVREIYRQDVKFDTRPGYPIKWSTGVNKYANVLGQKISNFGAEIFVLNNTSTTIPLSNGMEASLYIYGNTLGSSGELVYTTDSANTFNTKEPVLFGSTWLQNESDVKSLANWIKANVVNKGKLVEMSIFGNPLISVGDMVSINYLYQGLNGTENFIVTSIKHSFSQGLETSITCRAL
jgi:hypothetical protein